MSLSENAPVQGALWHGHNNQELSDPHHFAQVSRKTRGFLRTPARKTLREWCDKELDRSVPIVERSLRDYFTTTIFRISVSPPTESLLKNTPDPTS